MVKQKKKPSGKRPVNPLLEAFRKKQQTQQFNQFKPTNFKPVMPRGRRGDR